VVPDYNPQAGQPAFLVDSEGLSATMPRTTSYLDGLGTYGLWFRGTCTRCLEPPAPRQVMQRTPTFPWRVRGMGNANLEHTTIPVFSGFQGQITMSSAATPSRRGYHDVTALCLPPEPAARPFSRYRSQEIVKGYREWQ
jgi:hypothetical protein